MQILIVDDSQTVRFILNQMLHEMGYTEIVCTSDYDSAVNQLKKDTPDLILSDMNMPGKNGLDLLKFVRSTSEYTSVPFIILSTFYEKETMFQSIQAGAQYYLKKPVVKTELKEKLTALSQSHGIQAPV